MLNKFTTSVVITTLFLAMTIQASEEIQLYSEAGYPYENLIRKAKSVKILFTESEGDVICRVNILLSTQDKMTEKMKVSKKQFEEAPLASCLTRAKAKKILTLAYL